MIIRLQDIEMQAYHGVFPEERRLGNTFRVSVSIDVPDTLGVATDVLSDTLDYQCIYNIVVTEMSKPSNLLEHVAGRIRKAILIRYPDSVVHIQVAKKNPPLGEFNPAWAIVEL